ncbi:MAG: HAD-IIB family hydrolase [Planctomycetota bacterium]
MSAEQYGAIKCFILASDLDGTLIDHALPANQDEKLRRFARRLGEAGERLTLWFNSSRPVASQRASLRELRDLPVPAFHIGAMGTQVADDRGEVIESYGREQFGDWPRQDGVAIATERFGLAAHDAEMQTPFKASFDLPDVSIASEIESALQARGIPAKLVVSSGKDLDILPPAAGKASAIRWLAEHQNVAPEAVLVSGDSANDIDMFQPPFRGIVVGNGHAELRRHAAATDTPTYIATAHAAGGVLEGLAHFGVLPADQD